MFEERSETERGSAVPSLDDLPIWSDRPAPGPRWAAPQPGEEDVFGRIVPEPPDEPPDRPATADVLAEQRAAAERRAASRVTSAAVSALVSAVDAVLAQAPAELPEAQALADTAVLLVQIERLQGGMLGRVADVDTRRLYLRR